MIATKPAPDHDFLTVDEAADLFRVHPQTIKNWIKGGHLRYWRATETSVIRIPRSEIDRHTIADDR